MKLYVVRHGQSEGNRNGIHQNQHTPLSDIGVRQAQEAAKRFAAIHIDGIISSHYTRAHCTALEIAKVTGKEVEVNKLLREKKQPTEIEGKNKQDPFVVGIKKEISRNINDPAWHYSDEENYFDVIARAKKFLKMIESRPESSLAIISHGNMIGAVVGTILLGDNFSPAMFQVLEKSMWLSNTGITVLDNNQGYWHLTTWNDDAHLGNIQEIEQTSVPLI